MMEVYRSLRKNKSDLTPHEVSPPNVSGGDDRSPVKVNSATSSSKFHFGSSLPRNTNELEDFVRSKMSNVDDEVVYKTIARVINKLLKNRAKKLKEKGIDMKKIGALQEQFMRNSVRRIIFEAALGTDVIKGLQKFGITDPDDLEYLNDLINNPQQVSGDQSVVYRVDPKQILTISLGRLRVYEMLENLMNMIENLGDELRSAYMKSYQMKLAADIGEKQKIAADLRKRREMYLPSYKRFIQKYDNIRERWNDIAPVLFDKDYGVVRDADGNIEDVEFETIDMALQDFEDLIVDISEDMKSLTKYASALSISEVGNIDYIRFELYDLVTDAAEIYATSVGFEQPDVHELKPIDIKPAAAGDDEEEAEEEELTDLEARWDLNNALLSKEEIKRMKELQRKKISAAAEQKVKAKEEEAKAQASLQSELGLESPSSTSNAVKMVKIAFIYRMINAGHSYKSTASFPLAKKILDTVSKIRDVVYELRNAKMLQPALEKQKIPDIGKLRALFVGMDTTSIEDLYDQVRNETDDFPDSKLSKDMKQWDATADASQPDYKSNFVKKAIESNPDTFRVLNNEIVVPAYPDIASTRDLISTLYNSTSRSFARELAYAVGLKPSDSATDAAVKKMLEAEIKKDPSKFTISRLFQNEAEFNRFKDEIVPLIIADDKKQLAIVEEDPVMSNIVSIFNNTLQRMFGSGMRTLILSKKDDDENAS